MRDTLDLLYEALKVPPPLEPSAKCEMTVRLDLTQREMEELRERAAAGGMETSDYVGRLMETLAAAMTRDKRISDRVVFDETVFRRALLAPYGPEATCVAYALAGNCELLVTKQLIKHVHRDLQHAPATRESTAVLLRSLKEHLKFVPDVEEPEFKTRDYCRALALSNYKETHTIVTLVTNDREHLENVNFSGVWGAEMVLRLPELRVVDPRTFLSERAKEVEEFREKTASTVVHQRDVAHALDVARRAEEQSRLSRIVENIRSLGRGRDRD